MLQKKETEQLFSDFNKLRALIIGDIMLDTYIWGKVDRISPEAPVPIVAVQKRENRLGGAANVALNIQALGAEAVICSLTGDDDKAEELNTTLQRAGLSVNGINKSRFRKTTVKFRVFGNNTQLLRVDEESEDELNGEETELLKNTIKKIINSEKIDVITFQDYDKGVITPGIIDFTVELAKEKNIPVTADPKRRNFSAFKRVTLFKPNLKELTEGLNKEQVPETIEEIAEASKILMEQTEAGMVLATLSEKGALISWKSSNEVQKYHVPAHLRRIADVSGAGDTVISVASLCLALNKQPQEIAELSNLAGGLVCEEAGVVPVNKERFFEQALKLASS